MNTEINEILARRSSAKPKLVSHQTEELLNLRRWPAMLNTAQAAAMLGLAEHDIPVLVRAGQLKPLGNPPPTAVKSSATAQIMELPGGITSLNKIRNTVYGFWRGKNSSKPRSERNGFR
jgi:hypothetical protein